MDQSHSRKKKQDPCRTRYENITPELYTNVTLTTYDISQNLKTTQKKRPNQQPTTIWTSIKNTNTTYVEEIVKRQLKKKNFCFFYYILKYPILLFSINFNLEGRGVVYYPRACVKVRAHRGQSAAECGTQRVFVLSSTHVIQRQLVSINRLFN